jgi:preprotein translocase subunit SecE
MARDRKRAKQRQRQRQRASAPRPAQEGRRPAPEQSPPDPIEQAAPDAEEAKAAVTGEAIDVEAPEEDGAAVYGDEVTPDEIDPETLDDQVEPELAGDGRGGQPGDVAVEESDAGAPPDVRQRERAPTKGGEPLRAGGNRFVNFLRASWAELKRVQWPDRRQVAQATGVVLGFVIIAGGYLGLMDAIFSRVVDAIL